VWPHPLSVTYNWHFDHALARYWLDDAFIAGLLVITLLLVRSHSWIAASGLWFFALLAPSSSVVPIISEVAAERRIYLPLLALTSACAVGITYVAAQTRPTIRRAIAGLCALLVGACALGAYARARDYASAEKLFSAALRAAPDNPQAMWALASALDERGQTASALKLLERMAAQPYPYVGPASWGTRGLMAAAEIYARRGDRQRAQESVRRALTHDPASAIGRLTRAADLLRGGHELAALALLESMLDQPFLLARVHRELATIYTRRGDLSRAHDHLEQATQLSAQP
jgi:tetratricopeptide (TPR) repeat protein